jgi:transcriptional regulator with XRE-family HTH domain/tetratricopeptide (TPR) repeat protein
MGDYSLCFPDVPPEVWEREDMAHALAQRDICTVYRILHAHGLSQARIAAISGQAQSDVSAIMNGRAIRHYSVLERIAEGFAIPRGRMGLAYTGTFVGGRTQGNHNGDEKAKRRSFVVLAGAVVMREGTSTGRIPEFFPVHAVDAIRETSLSTRVGLSDVHALKQVVRDARAIDQRFGGYGQYQPTVASVRYAESLLRCRMSKRTRDELLSATASLHATAGWFAAEGGDTDNARAHYAQALDLGREAKDSFANARTLYAAGRTELHYGDAETASKLFQLATVAATRSPLLLCVMHANSAWAAARSGWRDAAMRNIECAYEQYEKANPVEDYFEFRWFGVADLAAVTGAAYLDLGEYGNAAADLARAVEHRRENEVRSIAFELANLADARIRLGDTDRGITTGRWAASMARRIRSARLPGRLAPLARSAEQAGSDGRQLAEELRNVPCFLPMKP